MLDFLNDELPNNENDFMAIASNISLGDRANQEDSFDYYIQDDFGIIALCDGMGGLNAGEVASSSSVKNVIEICKKHFKEMEITNLLKFSTLSSNNIVKNLFDDSGEKINAGCTLVSVFINNKELFWNSVGDSRIYLFRDNKLVQITQDHNYKTVIDEKLSCGMIDKNEYDTEISKGEALISYLGIDGEPLIDYNNIPFEITSGDRILMISDGLYKILSDNEISTVLSNFFNINDAVNALESKAKTIADNVGKIRDNTTIILILIK